MQATLSKQPYIEQKEAISTIIFHSYMQGKRCLKEKPKTKKTKIGEREERTKLEPWCCYIVFQPQSLQICFKSKPINKIKSNLDKIRSR